ncbi:hypothetical protein HF086_006302 [Spodoptera exigua]|uniref:Uncharacterized protein n=1 Tax=Spodoptera exigua TaxID=7107 RepID=A0A922M2Q9_SPOEX|nr:hypothetical protein HF086_006302 [Spodoptera exigua]
MALVDIFRNIDEITTLECHDFNQLDACKEYFKNINQITTWLWPTYPPVIPLGKKNNAWKIKTNEENIALELAEHDWSDIMNLNCASAAATLLTKTITDLIEKHTHKIKIPRSKFNLQPWITPGLIRCIKHRDNLHLSLRSDPENTFKKLIYTRYRNYCNKLLRKIRTDYDNRQIQENNKNPQMLWKVLKSIYDPSAKKNATSSVALNSTDLTDSLNKYNAYFTTVGKKLADTILTRISETQESLTSKYAPHKPSPTTFFLHPTDETEISYFISHLKNDSSPGPDRIGVRLLKKIQNSIITPLTHIINLSLETVHLPIYHLNFIHVLRTLQEKTVPVSVYNESNPFAT